MDGKQKMSRSHYRWVIVAAGGLLGCVAIGALNAAKLPRDMNLPGWRWHALKGAMAGRWSVTVNGNWRITYAFENGDAILVDYEDYH